MKIVKSTVRKVCISELKNLDLITVYLEDFHKGHGKIIIECFGKAWSNYWPGMGDRNIQEFFLSCDNHYLIGKFQPMLSQYRKTGDNFGKNLKAKIIERRHEDGFSKEQARIIWDKTEAAFVPESPDDLITDRSGDYDFLWGVSRMGEPSFDFDHEDVEMLFDNEVHHEWAYMSRIMDTVKEALKDD